jgi:DNA-binding transcriptional ArsR family regulator
MNYTQADAGVSGIAAAIGEPARTKMLLCLMDGRGRTSTELAIVAEVTPSTASVHLSRLKEQNLVKVLVQGKHRYYSLAGPNVGRALEGLSVLAGAPAPKFVPKTPERLRAARTCYDHIAGSLGVALHDRLKSISWVSVRGEEYDLTPEGISGVQALGVDIEEARRLRRRFAFGCLDWSERKPHLGGALAASLMEFALRKKWLERDLNDRALTITPRGRRELHTRLGLEF